MCLEPFAILKCSMEERLRTGTEDGRIMERERWGRNKLRERRTNSERGEEGKGNKVMKWMEEEQACTTVLSM